MELDLRTLFVETVLFEVLMAGLMLQYRRHRKVYPGFAQWTLAAFVFALGHVAYLVRPLVPLWLSVLGGAVGMCMAVVLRWDGVLRFAGRESLRSPWYALPVVLGAVMTGMIGPGWEAPWRNLLLTLVLSGLAMAYIVTLLTSTRGNRDIYLTAAAITLVEVVSLLIRAFAWFGETGPGLFVPSFANSMYFIVVMLCEVAANAVFMLMNSQRLEEEIVESQAELATTLDELRETRDGLKVLSGLLSICSECKKIQATRGVWEQMEVYVSRHTEVQFSHGLCFDCLNLHYRVLDDKDNRSPLADESRETGAPSPPLQAS